MGSVELEGLAEGAVEEGELDRYVRTTGLVGVRDGESSENRAAGRLDGV